MTNKQKFDEIRSQRKQILITPTMNEKAKLLGRVRGISFNELVNEALTDYIKGQMKNADIKTAIEVLNKTTKQ